MTNVVAVNQKLVHLSEILPLNVMSLIDIMCFRLTPEIDKELGNRLSFRFSRKFPGIVASWHERYFFVLGMIAQQMPSPSDWREAMIEIQEELKTDIGDRTFSIQWVRQPSTTPQVLAKLAVQILKVHRPLSTIVVKEKNGVKVVRKAEVYPETIELQNELKACISLTIDSKIVSTINLDEFFNNHPYRQNPEPIPLG